jgi:hypothetical protein
VFYAIGLRVGFTGAIARLTSKSAVTWITNEIASCVPEQHSGISVLRAENFRKELQGAQIHIKGKKE